MMVPSKDPKFQFDWEPPTYGQIGWGTPQKVNKVRIYGLRDGNLTGLRNLLHTLERTKSTQHWWTL